MASRLTLRLITPRSALLDVECDEVRAPGPNGSFGVLPGHAAYVATLDAGPLLYRDTEGYHAYAVVDGFVEVCDDVVTVLAEEAEAAASISLEDEEQAIAEARRRMEGLSPTSDAYKKEAAVIRRSAARALTARL
ncbi:MAG: ATP synthase F1 subunit epsilon [Deltaproteobacteria bacterium]|nr:MAG: ATP synthase F1 subunit epsilon [Deltaproteobacteria bacterium]